MDYQSGTATGATQDPQPTQPPIRMRMPFRVTTESVRPDGTGVFFGRFGRPVVILPDGTAPEVQQAVEAAMAGMDRVTTRFVMDARGETLEESTQVPSDIAPEMAASLRSSAKTVSGVSALFPNEPVGVGARWSVKQRIESEHVLIDQTSTNTLQAIDGNELRIACDVAQGAPVQRIESAALPPGTVMWLEALEGRGRGTSVVGLDGSTQEASLDLVARMRFRVESDGQTQAIFGVTTATLRVE